jgi:hypothetical protein
MKTVKPRTVQVPVSNCLDCPHVKRVTSSYTGDSFDMSDEDVICSLVTTNKHRCQEGLIVGKPIVVSERWRLREQCVIPDWCPLIKTSKKR